MQSTIIFIRCLVFVSLLFCLLVISVEKFTFIFGSMLNFIRNCELKHQMEFHFVNLSCQQVCNFWRVCLRLSVRVCVYVWVIFTIFNFQFASWYSFWYSNAYGCKYKDALCGYEYNLSCKYSFSNWKSFRALQLQISKIWIMILNRKVNAISNCLLRTAYCCISIWICILLFLLFILRVWDA